MIQLSIFAMRFFALAFGFYHGVLGFFNLQNYEIQAFVWAALSLYLLGLSLSVFIVGELSLPRWVAVFNLCTAVFVPLLVTAADVTGDPNPYTTWYVAGIGTLLAITAVRGHSTVAWVGIGFLVGEVLVWGGIEALFRSGLVGATLLVLGAQAAARALLSNEILVRQFRDRAITTEAATAAKSAARLEREVRIKSTLAGVLPQLENIVAKKGKLSPADQKLAALTEANLRDQIRGRNLSHPELTEETRKARERGVEVHLLDDGGLDQLSESEASELLIRVAKELSKIQEGKVVIRSVANEDWSLTIAAIRKGAEQPDLFLRL